MQFSKRFPFISFEKEASQRSQFPETGDQIEDQPEMGTGHTTPPLAEIDTTGVATLSSVLGLAQENPDEILKREGRKIYEEMVDKDAHLNAVYTTRRLALSRIPWEIKPADSSSEAKTHADFVRDAIMNCRGLFAEDIRQLADAIGKGFSVLEIRYKFIQSGRWKGKYGLKELVFHKQRYWRFRKQQVKKLTSEEVLFVGDNDFSGQTVPWEKVIHYAYMADDNLYGNAAFKPLYFMFWFKKEAGWKLWVVFLEKFAAPTVVGKYPPKAKDPEKEKLLECITVIQQETGITIPDTMSLEFMEASHAGPASYATLIDACNAEISKVLLGATQTVQEGRRGSYALARTHSEVRRERVEADAIDIMDVIQQQLVKRLVDYNFKTEEYPQFLMRFPQERTIPLEEGPGQPEKVGPESEVFPLPGEVDEKLAGPELTPEEQEIKLTPEKQEIELTPEKEEIRLAPEVQEAKLAPEQEISPPLYRETQYGQIPASLVEAAEKTQGRIMQDYERQLKAGHKPEAHVNAKYFKKAWLEILPEQQAFHEAGRISEDLKLALSRHVFSEQLEIDVAAKKIHDIFAAQMWSRYGILPTTLKHSAHDG